MSAVAMLAVFLALTAPWPSPAQQTGAPGTDVYVNVTGGGVKKLNIAVPEFTVVAGTDTAGNAKLLASVTGGDLTFSGLFSVVAGTGAIPPNSPAMLEQSWREFAAAGAHAGLHGLLTARSDRLEGEMRLYDLTTPDHRLIATKKFETPIALPRRLAHKIADDVVLQFTGESGIADTKLAYVMGPVGAKEIVISDYDGVGQAPVTRNGYVMDADGLSVRQLTSGGFHTQPRWSPKGDTLVYTARGATHDLWIVNVDGSNPRRLTGGTADNQGATWAPNGRHLAFQSNRNGRWQIFAMLADGSAQEAVTRGAGEATSPSWSPRLP